MDEVFVVAIVFGSILALMKMWLTYRKEKVQLTATSSPEPSLTESDLRRLITEAVEDVVERRISRLEKYLEERDRPRLMPASETNPDETELEHPAPPLVARDRDMTQ